MTVYRADTLTSPHTLDPRLGVIVHSHLRWDFVWQRPQQILSRIAERNPVLFVEEPCFVEDSTSPTLHITRTSGVVRVVPLLARHLESEYDEAIGVIRTLLRRALSRQPLVRYFNRVVQWFYTPMPARAMLDAFGEECVVYDCMDQLAQFRFAPPALTRREQYLLSRADIVFTGGYHLHQLKSQLHSNVHFLGCGVDAAHFGRARRTDTGLPPDVAQLARPVLGYFGVVDERLDYSLIDALALAFRTGTIAMVGPTAKVDAASLPKAPNVLWLGQRAYADLPAYVKAFDVCLMPFALNEATQYINPTKTLEYMAAGKPIVSTAVADVVRHFASVVRIARSPDEFVMAVAAALKRTSEERLQAGLALAAAHSWEAVVRQMSALIAASVARRTAKHVARHPNATLVPAVERGRTGTDSTAYADPVAGAS